LPVTKARQKRRETLAAVALGSPAFATTAALPAAPGVYRFRDEAGRALYVGRATDLRRRVRSYWQDVGDRRHLVRMVPRIARVEAVACVSGHEAAWLERNLLEHRMPPWNRTVGGQEVPCFLRLHDSDVRLAYDAAGPGRFFGPYLGGQQVRAAASALRRIYPLRYATGRLTGAERDMARVRGADAADPAALTASIVAVLDRDGAAVAAMRAALTARRDAASEVLAFELAATVQAEIDAIGWVTAAQRVTGRDGDAEVHGWHDGTLVRFALRGGRVREWVVSGCAERTAEARVADTPEPWRGFAAAGAELAAKLRGSRGGPTSG
jgi:excinuclease ABC subunit C